ncbi:MAG: GNAT family N-acetyltransferase [Bacteroidota bacterium]|nr:GNAT family N-acetyltransferase [Bacteroidota bacterium]
MKNALIRSAEKKDLAIVKALAEKIWPPTYSSILDAVQIEYMLRQMYSIHSLTQQMVEYHHHFLILEYDSKPAGFASYALFEKTKKGKLNKIYVDPALQGKGLGRFLLDYIVSLVKEAGCQTLQLDVNRYNKARYFYEKLGFLVTGEKDTDIGNGFFMNDYVMELSLADGTDQPGFAGSFDKQN